MDTAITRVFGQNGLSPAIFNLLARNRAAEKVITDYAHGHAAMDVGIGLVGMTGIPGAGTVALIGAVAAQAPLVYQPMAQELAAIYSAQPDQITSGMITDTVKLGAQFDIAAAFGVDYMTDVAMEMLPELGFGAFLSAVPFIGGLAGAALDAVIAWTLTWRVGTSVAMYYHNDEAWIGNQKTTYERAKRMVGQPSSDANRQVNLDGIPSANPEIMAKQMATVNILIDMFKTMTNDPTVMRSALRSKGIPDYLIDEAMAHIVH